jgi:predicted DsbA family dithiol-disulfide isomerase
MSSPTGRDRRAERLPGWRVPPILVIVALVGITVWAMPRLGDLFTSSEFDFVEFAEPVGFRSIRSEEFSSGWDPLTGVTGGQIPAVDADGERTGRELCRALFGTDAFAPGFVPIAYFSDYRCPYCRVLSGRLAEIGEEAGDSVHIAWHEWPVLGPASEVAAMAALAARRQGAYAAFHQRLIDSRLVPTPAYLRNLSEEVGIDGERLLQDMDAAEIEREIAQSRQLARLFGFPGTPGLVVGRTVVIGAISEPKLRALIERERQDGAIAACNA